MTVNAKRRNFCFALITFFISQTVYAQQRDRDFEAAVAAIRKNIQCCSVAFTGNHSFKATTATIFSGGEITIVYNKGHIPFSFNLFELHKNIQAPLGIYYKTDSKTVEFKTSESSSQAIRFGSVAKAKDTYDQIRRIIQTDHENYKPGFKLTIHQTVDSINALLRIANNDRAAITLLNDSVFKTAQMPSIRYDIDVAKLQNADSDAVFQVKGIAFMPYVEDGFGKGSRIVFQNGNKQMGLLQFTSADTDTQTTVYRLLIHLSDLMRNRN